MENQFMFDNISYIHLIWLLIVVFVFSVLMLVRKKNLIVRLTSENNFAHLARVVSIPRQTAKLIIKSLGILLVILALMRPLGSPEEQIVKVKGRDIVFVLDVSRSMLAEDEGLTTSRLERAKIAINDVVDTLSGDRVALVVFAGATTLKCPLTNDYNFFKTILRRTSVIDVNRGGSLIGDAIRFVDQNLLSEEEEDIRFKDIILITDGEDQESFPVEAAKSVVEKGIRIHTVGIGSLEGSRIPIRDERGYVIGFVKQSEEGNTAHRTQLNEEVLKEIAQITDGVYIPARTDIFYLDQLYNEYIATQEQRESEKQTKVRWTEMYQLFLIPGIILIIIAFIIPSRKNKSTNQSLANSLSMIVVLILPLLISVSCGGESYNLVEEANKEFMEDKISEAKSKYLKAQEKTEDSDPLRFNIAQTKFLEGDHQGAIDELNTLLSSDNDAVRRKALTTLGNVYMAQADASTEQNPQQAYQLYSKSIEQYRQVIDEINESLKLDENEPLTNDLLEKQKADKKLIKEAYNNLERAIIKRSELDIQDQQQQQQQQNQNQQQDQQNQQDQQQQQQQQNQNQQQDQQNQQDQQQQQQQQQPEKSLTAEEARQLLEKMRSESEDIEDQIQKQLYLQDSTSVERDW